MRTTSLIPIVSAAFAIFLAVYFFTRPDAPLDEPGDEQPVSSRTSTASPPPPLTPLSQDPTSNGADAGNPLFPREQDKPPSAAPPTEEQQALQEEREEEEEAKEVISQLNNVDPEKRTEAAEQLGAYPDKHSEKILSQVLLNDPAASVREAAAQSLVLFENHSKATWSALLSSLEDSSPEVQSAAAATVDTLLMQYDDNPRRLNWIRDNIERIVSSPKLEPDTRDALQNIIDQREDDASP